MTEKEWFEASEPTDGPMIYGASLISHMKWLKPGKRGTTGRRLRLVACGFFRCTWERLPDDAVRRAVEAAEAFADKEVGVEGLLAASADVEVEQLREHSPYRVACYTLLQRRHDKAVRLPALFAQTCEVVRDIFGNPFQPTPILPAWRTSTAVAIARSMYESRDFGPMPLLADALQDAGCEVPEIIDHCRGPGPHVRGCWVVDGVLGKT